MGMPIPSLWGYIPKREFEGKPHDFIVLILSIEKYSKWFKGLQEYLKDLSTM